MEDPSFSSLIIDFLFFFFDKDITFYLLECAI